MADAPAPGRVLAPLLLVAVVVVIVLLVLVTGNHTVTTPSTTSAPTGKNWDNALISLALTLTTRLIWLTPLLVVIAAFLHYTHFYAHIARILLIRAALGAGLLLLVPILIVALPHILQFRDHIVSELLGRG